MPNMLINSASCQLAVLHRYFSATGQYVEYVEWLIDNHT